MDKSEVLRHSGLDDKETATYLALLELGETTVMVVAKKAGIKRPTAYLVLDSLEKKGFVSRIVKGNKVFFTPQHPKKIVTEAELRLEELRQTVPQLEELIARSEKKPRVMIYEGRPTIDRAYDDAFIQKGEIVFISNIELTQKVGPQSFAKLDYKGASPDWSMREVVDGNPHSLAYARRVQGPYRQIRVMPPQFAPFATDVAVFGNFVTITSVKKEIFTVKIESEEIAQAFRALFEAMWQLSVSISPTT